MAIRTFRDSREGSAPLIDAEIGDAYPIVKTVAAALQEIRYVAENLHAVQLRDVELGVDEVNHKLLWRYEHETSWRTLVTFDTLLGDSITTVIPTISQIRDTILGYLNGVIAERGTIEDISSLVHTARDVTLQARDESVATKPYHGPTPPTDPEYKRWLSTDTGREYVLFTDGDSTQWVEVGAFPSSIAGAALKDALDTLAAPGGAKSVGFSHAQVYVAGSVGAKLRQFVSIKDAPYNAVGDGVADDTAAIQAALNSGAKFIYIPLGTYKITANLNIASNDVTVYGPGVISIAAHNVYGFNITGNSNVIYRIKIVNAGAFTLTDIAVFPKAAGVFISGSNNVVEGCVIENLVNGVLVSGPNPNQCVGNRVINNKIAVRPFNYGANKGWPNDGVLSFFAISTVIQGNTVGVYTAPGALVLTGTAYTFARGAIICDISSENNLVSTNTCGEGFLATMHNERGTGNVLVNNKAYKGDLCTIVGGSGRIEYNQVIGPAYRADQGILNAAITMIGDAIIVGNAITCNDAQVPAIQLQGNGNNYRISNNTIRGTYKHGIVGNHKQDLYIESNTLEGTYTAGINTGCVAPEIGRVFIRGNSCSGTYVNAVVGTPLLSAMIANNSFTNSTGDTITVSGSSDEITIAGNDLATINAATYAVKLGFTGANRYAIISSNNMLGHTVAVAANFSEFVSHQLVTNNLNNTTAAL